MKLPTCYAKIAILLVPLLLSYLLYAQAPLQVGYAVLTATEGSRVPVGTALFSFTNTSNVLLWEAAVSAAEPIRSGRIFVDQRGTRTALALVNPSAQTVTAALILRNSSGVEVGRISRTFGPRQNVALFVDELFPELNSASQGSAFSGSLTFETAQSSQTLAAITLRENRNARGETIYATLPVVNLQEDLNQPALIFPQIGAGPALGTQIVLINRSSQSVSGSIKFVAPGGDPLTLQLTKGDPHQPVAQNSELLKRITARPRLPESSATGSDFPFQIAANGTYRADVSSAQATAVGYAVVTPSPGSALPAGVAVFQFRSSGSAISETGVSSVAPTSTARIFVDQAGTRTGVAVAAAGSSAVTIAFNLLNRGGIPIQKATRSIAAGGQIASFVDELFADLPQGFTGLMEITSTAPIAAVALKLTSNARNEPIITTLPVADLNRPLTAAFLVFPRVGFGFAGEGTFSTRLIFINGDTARPSDATLDFYQPDGSALAVIIGAQARSQFHYRLLPGAGLQFPSQDASAATQLLIDPANPASTEITVNEGNTIRIRPTLVDSTGNWRDDSDFAYISLSPDTASIDNSGNIQAKKAGFSTLTISSGRAVSTATITVVKVTSGVSGFEITGVAQDLSHRLYLADTKNHAILLTRSLEEPPVLYAGVQRTPGLQNDERLKALFRNPAYVAFNQAEGSLYVSDEANHVIRRIRPGTSGRVETLAGTGQAGSQDGAVSVATFNNPQGVALDNRGNLWVADSGNHSIRRISLLTGSVTTIAGKSGTSGLADGTKDQARFRNPIGIAIETETLAQQLERQARDEPPPPVRVVVADSGNGSLRRVREDGLVETLAFTAPSAATALTTQKLSSTIITSSASRSAADDAPGANASIPLTFNNPAGVAVDSLGNIYVTEPHSGQVKTVLQNRVVVAAAQTNTFAGPRGIVIGESGKVLVAETGRSGRQIAYGVPKIIAVTPDRVSSRGGARVTVRGENFPPDSQVFVAGVAVTGSTINDTQTITFVMPPLRSGRTTVTVQSRGGLAQKDVLIEAVPFSELPAGHITTVAGGSTFTGEGTPATSAALSVPAVAVDSAGNIYVADGSNHRVRRIEALTGIVTTVAGNGQAFSSGDGLPALAAAVLEPRALAFDSTGSLFITTGYGVRKVEVATGIITTVAGPNYGFCGDGEAATGACFNFINAIAVDARGNLFIADTFNHRIRKVDAATKIITTVAGNGVQGFSGDTNRATESSLNNPVGVAVDSLGNLFIADTGNHRIRQVDTSGFISTVAGNGADAFAGDGLNATTVGSLSLPTSVAVDSSGNLFIADRGNSRIRKVGVDGIITTVAGNGDTDFSGDNGKATQAALHEPIGIAVDGAGNLIIADSRNGRVRRVDAITGIITTIGGIGQNRFFGDNGPATAAALIDPVGVALDASSNLLISDNGTVRRVDANGVISTIAGGAQPPDGLGDNGPATAASLGQTDGIAVDSAGNLFIATPYSLYSRARVRKVDRNGIITTVAGGAPMDNLGDNRPGPEASLNAALGVAVDKSGNLYIADSGNNRIRKVNVATGVITTIAGNGESVFNGDNGPALSAVIPEPERIAVDDQGNIYVAHNNGPADPYNGRVRKISPSGAVVTVAGGGAGYSDNQPATAVALTPAAVTLDTNGNLYLIDVAVVRRVDAKTGIITTVAGGGNPPDDLGDNGPATGASFFYPRDLVFDKNGNLYIADSDNARVRVVRGPIK